VHGAERFRADGGRSRAIRQLEEFGVDEEFNVERARGR